MVLTELTEPAVRRVRWRSATRVIPSRYPTVSLFERVAPAEDFDVLYDIESLTNARLRDESGEAPLMDARERVYGPGSSYIMAPFAHTSPDGGRFNPPGTGAFYAARDAATAVAETCYHRARFMARTREPPLELDMRVLVARLDARLHDVRGRAADLPEIYEPVVYASAQALGARLREAGSWGVVYDSVRHPGGQCVAVFRPRALSDCRQGAHLVYVWDGERIARVYEKRVYAPGAM